MGHDCLFSYQPRVRLHLDGGPVPPVHGRAGQRRRAPQHDLAGRALPPGPAIAAHEHALARARHPRGPPCRGGGARSERVALALRGGYAGTVLHVRPGLLVRDFIGRVW